MFAFICFHSLVSSLRSASGKSKDDGADADGDEDMAATAAMPNQQLSELYANCIKLCTENVSVQSGSWLVSLVFEASM